MKCYTENFTFILDFFQIIVYIPQKHNTALELCFVLFLSHFFILRIYFYIKTWRASL